MAENQLHAKPQNTGAWIQSPWAACRVTARPFPETQHASWLTPRDQGWAGSLTTAAARCPRRLESSCRTDGNWKGTPGPWRQLLMEVTYTDMASRQVIHIKTNEQTNRAHGMSNRVGYLKWESPPRPWRTRSTHQAPKWLRGSMGWVPFILPSSVKQPQSLN